jgi:hypothetical protein
MICRNCNFENNDDAVRCSFCNIYLLSLRLEDDETKDNMFVLENNIKFELKNDIGDITVGRKDLNSNPVIDLGPFDNGPYVSRIHGSFSWKDNEIYYTDKSKNGTIINNEKIQKTEVKLKNGDILVFGKVKGAIVIS